MDQRRGLIFLRHARLHAGHPRLTLKNEDVDGRDKPGHDRLENRPAIAPAVFVSRRQRAVFA
jgi:hypothetical protein